MQKRISFEPGGEEEAAFIQLVYAAVHNHRCPLNGFGHVNQHSLAKLAATGHIKIELSGRNWRRVTILKGCAASCATAPNPRGHHVWKTITAQGTTLSKRAFVPPRRDRQPWRPPLRASEAA